MTRTGPSRAVPAAGEGKRGPQGHISYLLRQADGAARSALDSALAEVGLTTPQFLASLNKVDREYAELAAYVRTVTPHHAIRLRIPFGQLERAPKMTTVENERLRERNRLSGVARNGRSHGWQESAVSSSCG